jgi:myosin-crossreactive antigen
MAVYNLFDTGRKVPPVYPSRYMPKHLVEAVQAISR